MFKITFTAVCVLLFFFIFQHPIFATEPQLKIITYNTWTGGVTTDQQASDEMLNLANYLKVNNIDIIALQEMNDWQRGERTLRLSGDDALYLEQHLKNINYPMFWYAKPYQYGIGLWYRNVTFSKFPIVKNGFSDYQITNNKRWGIETTFKTPLGLVTIMNIHTYQKNNFTPVVCEQIKVIDKRIIEHFNYNKRLFILGDWNEILYYGNHCNGWAEGFKSRYEFFCGSVCNSSIDYAVSPKNNVFSLVEAYKDNEKSGSNHKPVISIISLKNKTNYNEIYDLNQDNKFNLKDVFFLVSNTYNWEIKELVAMIKKL